MPRWVRTTFLGIMPKLLCMKRPKPVIRKMVEHNKQLRNGLMTIPGIGDFSINPAHHHPMCPSSDQPNCQPPLIELTHTEGARIMERDAATGAFYPLSPEAMRAIDAIEYITDHLKQDEEYKMYRDDWKYVAMIIDRLLLYIFLGITVGGTCGILFSAPYVFDNVDQKRELQRLIQLYKSGGQFL